MKKYLVRTIIAFLQEKSPCRPCFEFEPSLFEPGVYFNIKCIGKLPGPTNEFQRSLVFETGEFELPKFDCTSRYLDDILNIYNVYFDNMVSQIYPSELQLNKANASDTEAVF